LSSKTRGGLSFYMKISLSCIVGNEEERIEEFIHSFKHVATKMIFVRATGNVTPDKTCEIIATVCESIGMPYVIDIYENEIDFPHVDNFGKARQMSWNIARQDSDWVFWADADDSISIETAQMIKDVLKTTTHDAFSCIYNIGNKTQLVPRERFAKSSVNVKWNRKVHEYFTVPNNEIGTHCEISFVHSCLPKPVSNRNSNILIESLNETANDLYYLASQYKVENKPEPFLQAAEAFFALIDFGTNNEMVKSQLYYLLTWSAIWSNKENDYLEKAKEIYPYRREAVAYEVTKKLAGGDYAEALVLCEKMISTPMPPTITWNEEILWRGWRSNELYRQCLRKNGRQKDADLHFKQNINPLYPVFTIVHATLERQMQALIAKDAWFSKAAHPENVEYIFGIHKKDVTSVGILDGFKHTVTDLEGCNCNYDVAAGEATGSILIQGADDTEPDLHWDNTLNQIIVDSSQPVSVIVNDGQNSERPTTLVLTKAYMDIKKERETGENGFFSRSYPTLYSDDENHIRAIKDNAENLVTYLDARNSITVKHNHYIFNNNIPFDETYKKQYDSDKREKSLEVFKARNFS